MSDKEQKFRTITVDTLTGIQVEQYMADKSKPNFNKWKDYGQDIWVFMSDLQRLGFENILILGEPGTGKSSGMRTLKPSTNIWFNADKKNPVWRGGREEYGSKINPKKPYHFLPKSYSEIIKIAEEAVKKDKFEEQRFAILTGHLENYKSGNDTRMRLKTLGNMATDMQLEGKLETVLYSKVESNSEGVKYLLETQNNGYNTARSPQDMLEPKIENDYQLIIDKLLQY